ncbi:hypothetical protein KH172YL63_10440 [Bacillus sp. KH172YL63]|nr:hypothetical protein KH172YL63_10440 [Bacillus sp. KH172YL63]
MGLKGWIKSATTGPILIVAVSGLNEIQLFSNSGMEENNESPVSNIICKESVFASRHVTLREACPTQSVMFR